MIKRGFTLYLPLLFFLLWTVFPIYWIFITALKPNRETFTFPIYYVPREPTLENFVAIFDKTRFGTFFLNSVLVSTATTLLLIVLIALAGYGYSRFKFKGKKLVMLLFLATQMLPGISVIIPIFVIFRSLGLIDTYVGLILIYTTGLLPFSTFLMMGFYQAIPRHLDEAAMIDGCSRLQALIRVILPLVLPGLVASAIFGFINAWNELVMAIMFINRVELQTVPIGILNMQGEFITQYSWIAAAGSIALLPVMILFGFVQRYLTGGLVAGAVKG